MLSIRNQLFNQWHVTRIIPNSKPGPLLNKLTSYLALHNRRFSLEMRQGNGFTLHWQRHISLLIDIRYMHRAQHFHFTWRKSRKSDWKEEKKIRELNLIIICRHIKLMSSMRQRQHIRFASSTFPTSGKPNAVEMESKDWAWIIFRLNKKK